MGLDVLAQSLTEIAGDLVVQPIQVAPAGLHTLAECFDRGSARSDVGRRSLMTEHGIGLLDELSVPPMSWKNGRASTRDSLPIPRARTPLRFGGSRMEPWCSSGSGSFRQVPCLKR